MEVKILGKDIGICQHLVYQHEEDEYNCTHHKSFLQFKKFKANENLYKIFPKLSKNIDDSIDILLEFYPITGELIFYKEIVKPYFKWEKFFETNILLENLIIED